MIRCSSCAAVLNDSKICWNCLIETNQEDCIKEHILDCQECGKSKVNKTCSECIYD